jgi:hypothetical protein
VGSAWGDTVQLFGVANRMTKKLQYKIHCAFWWPLVKHFTYNNQPKTDAHDGGEYGENVRPGGRCGQSAIATFGGIKI